MMRAGRREMACAGARGVAGIRHRRCVAAGLLVACLVLATAASGAIERASPRPASPGASGAIEQAGFSAVMGASDAAAYAVGADVASSAFSGELPTLVGEEDVLLDEASSIVAYLTWGTAKTAASDLGARMESGGWARVSSGSEAFETFRKEGGTYRWAFAAYAEIGGRVRVTIQCA